MKEIRFKVLTLSILTNQGARKDVTWITGKAALQREQHPQCMTSCCLGLDTSLKEWFNKNVADQLRDLAFHKHASNCMQNWSCERLFP